MKRKNNKKKIAIVSSLLALLAILAGTFAWTSYTEWVRNHMQSKGFEAGRVTIVEEFNPPKGGIEESPEVTKKVNVVNTTSDDAFVRVSFEEVLHKLADGANKKVYGTTGDAKFPVIIDSSEYRNPAVYNDKSTDLVIKTAKGGSVVAPNTLLVAGETLKLYVTPDDSKGVLIVEKPMKKAAFPDNFDFEGHTAAIPVISGSFGTADNAVVAQKVSALVEKQPDGSYEVYTGEYTDADADMKNLGFWGYGVDKGTMTEADWAGATVNVSASVTVGAGTLGQSKLDANIKFAQADVVTTLPAPGTGQDKWYYNATDGYFYYLNVLTAGATTTSVMEKVTFPTVATDPTYYVAAYDLWVGLEAIPASQSALTAASNGGAFVGTPTVEGNKTWESNGSGWGLTDTTLLNYFNPLATIVE